MRIVQAALALAILVTYTTSRAEELNGSLQYGLGPLITVTGLKPNSQCGLQSYTMDSDLNGTNKRVRAIPRERGCGLDQRVISTLCILADHLDSAFHYSSIDVVKFALRGDRSYSSAELKKLLAKIETVYSGPVITDNACFRRSENKLATPQGGRSYCAIISACRAENAAILKSTHTNAQLCLHISKR